MCVCVCVQIEERKKDEKDNFWFHCCDICSKYNWSLEVCRIQLESILRLLGKDHFGRHQSKFTSPRYTSIYANIGISENKNRLNKTEQSELNPICACVSV